MLTLWNNFDRTLDNELRLMNRLFRDSEVRPRFEHTVAPRVDVIEKEDSFELTAEVPGYKPDEVEITVHEGTLTIAGRVEAEARDRQNGGQEAESRIVYRERRRSSFSRSFKLGDAVNADAIEATVKDGLLTVVLPKAPESKPRQIAIKASH